MTKLQRKTKQKAAWIAVGAGSAMVASSIVERSLAAGWRATTRKNPPATLDARKTGWGEALMWTAASALALGLTQVLARRGAALGWEYATGKYPPV
jgi:hypothetical protein